MHDEKFIKLLPVELKFVFRVFGESFLVGNAVVLSAKEGLEGKHTWLETTSILNASAPDNAITFLFPKNV